MKKLSALLILFLLLSCKKNPPQIIQTDDYELTIPENPKAVLILFPGFNGDAKRINQESKIPKEAIDNQIAVMLFNSYNQHLFLTDEEKNGLEKIISTTMTENNLENKSLFLGGFSSGGNVTLLIADKLNPKGLFIVDSPVDLADYYFRCEKKLQNNSGNKIVFSKYFYNFFNKKFGNPNENISHYENYAPYTYISDFTYNINFLKNMSIRLYTEPDIDFYKEIYNDFTFSDLNTYSIKKMYKSLKDKGHTDIKYIESHDKGYLSNGERNPHSWSIVNEKEIIEWVLEND